MRKSGRRWTAVLLAAMLLASCIPSSVLAGSDVTEEVTVTADAEEAEEAAAEETAEAEGAAAEETAEAEEAAAEESAEAEEAVEEAEETSAGEAAGEEEAEETAEAAETAEAGETEEAAAEEAAEAEEAVDEEAAAEEAAETEEAAEDAAEEAVLNAEESETSKDLSGSEEDAAEDKEDASEDEEDASEDKEDAGCAADEYTKTTDDGITVSLEWDENAFTDNPEVVVEDLDEETALAYAEEALEDGGVTVTEAYGVDITFYVDDEEVQPASAVRVTLELTSRTISDADNIYIVHKHDGEDAVLLGDSEGIADTDDSVGEADVSVEEDGETVTVEIELTEFSSTVISGGDEEGDEEDEGEDTDTNETPEATVWERSKSKTATNLDEDYISEVTLSLPAADYTAAIDVVFVMDASTSADNDNLANAAADFIDTLAGYEDIEVKVGVVIFGGYTPILYKSASLLSLSVSGNAEILKDKVID